MATEIFIDTSGFYACLERGDDRHGEAATILRQARGRRRFVTTDYVLDETITLLKMRGRGHLLERFLDLAIESSACAIEWMSASRFEVTRSFLFKHGDHDYSFTDCFSLTVMRERGLQDALTKDEHFAEAGFRPLLV